MKIKNISVCDFFWVGFNNNRVSFSFRGLCDGVHFTFSRGRNGRMNLHISKNVRGDREKPRVVIALFDQGFLDELTIILNQLIFTEIFQPISFKKYSRKSRKNIKLFFLDDIKKGGLEFYNKDLYKVWQRNTEIKRKRFILKKEIESDFRSIIHTKPIQSLLSNKTTNLTSNSFAGANIRSGIILMGKKNMPFVTVNGKCYAMVKRMSVYDLLIKIATPEFANSIIEYVNLALEKVSSIETSEDINTFSRPFELYFENVGQKKKSG